MADDSQAVLETGHWVAAATTRELKRRRKLRVELEGRAIALFAAGDNVYAFDDLCVHQGNRSLSKGTMLHGRVVCPGHQWQFDLDTGYEPDQDVCQPTYRVRVVDDTIHVDLSPRTGNTQQRKIS